MPANPPSPDPVVAAGPSPVLRRVATLAALLRPVLQKARWALLFALRPSFRRVCRSPVFIVGCSHSGTTLLVRIIGAHPRVHGLLDETKVFCSGRAGRLAEFDIETYRLGKDRWAEKTPEHINHLEEIFRARPGARVLLILRDGRDVAVSIRKRNNAFESAVKQWMETNRNSEAWWNDPRMKVIRYEKLVQEFEATVTDCLAFLDLPFSQDCLSYYEKFKQPGQSERRPESAFGKNHLAYRMWQVSQPVFDGRGRWKDEMSEDEKAVFKKLAGEQLIRYGYAADLDW